MNQKALIREIEGHLRKFHTYKAGIKNLQRQINYIYPNVTAKYEFTRSGSGFVVSSSTEKTALDRIESKRALDLLEQIERFKIIVESIDEALNELQDQEREFIELRYFKDMSWNDIQRQLNYSERQLFYIRRKTLEKLLISLKNLFSL